MSDVMSDMSDVLMRLDGVSRCYGTGEAMVWALRDVSLSIHAGDFVSIVGPSSPPRPSDSDCCGMAPEHLLHICWT